MKYGFATAVVLLLSSAVNAAEVRVLSTQATEQAYRDLVAEFEHATGHTVATVLTGTIDIERRLAAGERYDVLIMAAPSIEAHLRDGLLVQGSRANLATSGIGVAVRPGAPKPDISSVEALKATIVSAASIGCATGPSGIYMLALFERLGLAQEVKAKLTQTPSGTVVGQILASGQVELGFQQISELSQYPGIDYIGPLPPAVQEYTVFAAGLMAGAKEVDAAKALIAFLTSPAAAPTFRKRGMEPANETRAPEIPGVVAGGTRVVLLKEGFGSSDGPVTLPDGSVIFSEPTKNRIYKIDKNDTFSVFLEGTNGANGLVIDSKGRIIAADTAPGRAAISVIYPKAAAATLIDRVNGQRLGRPNDLVVDTKGGIYFTDPGMNAEQLEEARKALGGEMGSPPPVAVHYIPPGGKAVKVAENIERPNGVQLTRDEKTLFINNTNGEYMLAFDIQPDGTLANRRNFAKYEGRSAIPNGIPGIMSGADGLVIDSEGRLYALTGAGVEIFDPRGQKLGTIPLPSRGQNLGFAGPDKKTLYIVGDGRVFKIQMLAQGFKGRAK